MTVHAKNREVAPCIIDVGHIRSAKKAIMLSRKLKGFILCLLTIGALPASAQAGGLSLAQFQHTAWNLPHGAPSQINGLAQTKDGYLWLGTANGLFRFDGVTFEAYQLSKGQHFRHTSIQTLTATEDGGLWIGYTLGRVDFLKDGNLQPQRFERAPSGGTVFSIVQAHDGSTWAATMTCLFHRVGGIWREASQVRGLNIKASYFLLEDSKGTLWLTSDDFIYRLPANAEKFESTGISGGGSSVFVEGQNGTMWICVGPSVFRYADLRSGKSVSKQFLQSSDINDLRIDASGALWILSTKTGVTRIPNPDAALQLAPASGKILTKHFSTQDGLTSDFATTSLVDREGNIWIGTPGGLDKFRSSALEPAPVPDSLGSYALAPLPGGSVLIGTEFDGLQMLNAGTLTRLKQVTLDDVSCVYKAPDGKIWLGGKGDLGYWESGHFVSVPVPDNIRSPTRDTQAMTADANGDLWLQTAALEPIMKFHHGRWSTAASNENQSAALTLTTDHMGQVWAGYIDDVIRVFDRDNSTTLDKATGITVGNVTALYDSGSNMWIGGQRGIDVMVSGHPVPVRFAGSANIEGISGIIRVENGDMWINSLTGVVRVYAEDIAHFLRDTSYALPYRLFDYLDGLYAKAPQLRPLPSIVEGPGHTLWFTTTNGAASINTTNVYRNPIPPPVSIGGLNVDGVAFEPHGLVQLPKGAQSVQINYSALSLSIPERVIFRYQLEGYDKGWQEAGTRRQALYSHLPPGHYIFHVIACNDSGLWNTTGATIAITVLPTFTETMWFKLIVLFASMALLFLIFRIRLNLTKRRIATNMYEILAERQRIARDLHDTLLQSVQALMFKFAVATNKLTVDDPVRPILAATLAQSDQVLLEGRKLISNLQTSEEPSGALLEALRAVGEELRTTYPLTQLLVESTGTERELSTVLREEFYSVGREALSNAFRHADAAHVWLSLSATTAELRLYVSDDGKGIDEEVLAKGYRPEHWGLRNMKDRAKRLGARFTIRSSPETGTTIAITAPAFVAYKDAPRGLRARFGLLWKR
jgi:signal transduction histidine kinase/ligand-binding sensor domain-containing protein